MVRERIFSRLGFSRVFCDASIVMFDTCRSKMKFLENAVIKFCLETLSEALPGFAYIGTLQAMDCELALANGSSMAPQAILLELMGGRSWYSFSRENKLNCCECLTYAQSIDLLREQLDPNVANDFEREWENFIEAQGEPKRILRFICSSLYSVSWIDANILIITFPAWTPQEIFFQLFASCQILSQHRLLHLLPLLIQRLHTSMYRGNTTTQILPSLLTLHAFALSFPGY